MDEHQSLFCVMANVPSCELSSELFDTMHRVKEKKAVFDADVATCGGLEPYKREISRISAEAETWLASDPTFSAFQKHPPPKRSRDGGKGIFTAKWAGRGLSFLSIDVRTGNYRALTIACPALFPPRSQWADFISRFTTLQSVISSRHFRQVFFGKLGITELARPILEKLCDAAHARVQALYPECLQVAVATSDEYVYVKVDGKVNVDADVLRADLEDKWPGVFRVEPFTLDRMCLVPKHPCYVKTYPDGTSELKGCPWFHLPTYILHLEGARSPVVADVPPGTPPP
jgi:hypothetical protein